MTTRVALISGASRGIGLAVARTLQQNGWSLSLGLRDTTDVAPELSHQHVVQHDARSADEQAWVQAAMDRFGRIDAVACCAGIMTPRDIVEIDDETLDAMWEVNVKSPRRLVSAAWEPLKQGGKGRVAVLASLSGKRVKSSASSSYALTKHAAVALVHGFRQTGWEHGIRATAICPGFVNTDMARAITETDPAAMTQASDLAELVRTAIELPNTASVAELSVNCQLEELF
ncbi:SDR family NAD(P)-dependent oxidoreductase [Salipiger mucosus]|uniref:3-oxoacyl-[acyl-carrier protein] reductase n=1 Tax=Salipiger mucosus DSM 16094 TaxID=1123237 RepID=S9QYS3_9RHOB|nr:SDR family NAD(P)-dependent oxidoreductase [Salipiger mucosus]EPX84803.1 3-oxoacyl-[acyl-carrier protein] reductase [Salipiger mucosus DSM 16094]